MPLQSRLEYDRRGIMGSAPSNTCCFSTVSTTMRADPHVRYRRDSSEKMKRLNLAPLVCARFKGLIPSEIDQDLTPPRIGNEGSGAIARGRSAQASAGEAGERKDRGVLRMAGGAAGNAEHRERKPDVERNGMEEPLEEAAQSSPNISRRKEAERICSPDPSALPRSQSKC